MVKTLKDFSHWTEMKNQIIRADCLEGMKLIPDKSVDLVLTDPPYGIGMDGVVGIKGKSAPKQYEQTNWDKQTPSKECFSEIIRTSKNQAIFGGNYFIEYLHNSPCWIVWDKKNDESVFADCELVWTSFKTAVRVFRWRWQGMIQEQMGKNKEYRHHPTQKPLELMRWILENYSKEGDLICDPFMGSWTTARACKDLGRDFIGFEISEEYCKIGVERLKQQNLF